MKLSQAFKCLLLVAAVDAFAPSSRITSRYVASSSSARQLAFDPASLHDLSSQLNQFQDAFSTLSLSDAMDVAPAVDSAVAADAAAEVAKSDAGWFGFLVGPIEFLLQAIHGLLVNVGMSADAWGVTIIAMTLVIKIATFPLTKAQLESGEKMKALQPALKEIQAKYQSNPEVMNQKVAEFYQSNDVNPLAGCLPALVQIPVFIGLYRAVLNLAKENKLDEPFLWLPNLEGPVYGADPTQGNAWLFQGWTDGVPPLGWEDTTAFLVLPVFLVVSQFLSMEIMTPKDQQQQQPAVLKFLPLMFGWFSLGFPAALCLYWVTNNIVTTATSVIVRNSLNLEPVTAGATTAAVSAPPPSEIFAPSPLREKPAGFSETSVSSAASDGVTPITGAIDAEVVSDEDSGSSTGMSSEVPTKKRGGKKKKRRKN